MQIINRRMFLGEAALAAGFLGTGCSCFSSAIPPRVRKPGEKPTLAMIGVGIQSRTLTHQFLGQDIVIVGVCDVDKTRRAEAAERVRKYYASRPELKIAPDVCKEYSDFREVLANPGIDMVCIATPDHWHAYITIEAMKAGKDVYCEKPLTYNIAEASMVMAAAKKYGRILQTGAMQRSSVEFRVACELVQNGAIGKVNYVDCCFGGPSRPHRDYENPANAAKEGAPNPDVDFNMWCGGAPLVKYSDQLAPRGVHNFYPMFWRMDDYFGSGMCGDWGAHHLDIAQWGLGMDYSGPVKIIKSNAPKQGGIYGNRAQEGMKFVFENGAVMEHCPWHTWGTIFYGTDGIVAVNRGVFGMWQCKDIGPSKEIRDALRKGGNDAMKKVGWWQRAGKNEKLEGMSKSVLDAVNRAIKAYDLKNAKVKLYKSQNHPADFVARFLDRKPACSNEQVGGRSATLCHLCNMSYVRDTSFDWDPEDMTFANGTGDVKWLAREVYRDNWKVQV